MKLFISSPKGRWALVAKEAKRLWYKPFDSFDSWTYLDGDMESIYKLNLRSRVANKIYIQATQRTCIDFDQLFELCEKVDWSQYIKAEQWVYVQARTKKSLLTSIPSIQSIALKAIMKKLTGNTWDTLWHINKNIPPLNVVIHIDTNKVSILINTSGSSLHERGYRQDTWKAPIKENVAAALVLQSGRKFTDSFRDPFCGSGTICIEAAMIARNIAPWLARDFAFEHFPEYDKEKFEKLRQDALDKQFDKKYEIIWSDIDSEMTKIARKNAQKAQVEDTIRFIKKDFFQEEKPQFQSENIHIATNPPYGKRINKDIAKKASDTLERMGSKWEFSGWFITLMPPLHLNKKHRKTKPCFNGPDLCTFYQIKKVW